MVQTEKAAEMIKAALELLGHAYSMIKDAQAIEAENSKETYSPKEASEYLCKKGLPFKKTSLEVMRAQRRGPKFYKHSRFVFYRKEDLDAFVSEAKPRNVG